MGFFQNAVNKRTEIETTKAKLALEGQVGLRSNLIMGSLVPDVKSAFQSLTKYPRILAAGVFGAKDPDTAVDVPVLPPALENTEFARDLATSAQKKQDRIEGEQKAYEAILANPGKGLVGRLRDYKQYKSGAGHSDFKDAMTIQQKPGTLSSLASMAALGAGLYGQVKLANATFDAMKDVGSAHLAGHTLTPGLATGFPVAGASPEMLGNFAATPGFGEMAIEGLRSVIA